MATERNSVDGVDAPSGEINNVAPLVVSNLINGGGDNQMDVPPPVVSSLVNGGADASGDNQNDVVDVPPPVVSSLVNGGADASGDNKNDVDVPPPVLVSNLNPMASEWKPDNNWTPEKERALFMTFSKGYPVTDLEIESYFESKFGENCLEKVFIKQPRHEGEQAKFGYVVFRACYMPVAVLHDCGGDGEKARHYIGGRAVWFKIYRGKL